MKLKFIFNEDLKRLLPVEVVEQIYKQWEELEITEHFRTSDFSRILWGTKAMQVYSQFYDSLINSQGDLVEFYIKSCHYKNVYFCLGVHKSKGSFIEVSLALNEYAKEL